MRRLPFHPLLLGVWPVLLLWAENSQEAATADVVPVLGRMLLLAAVLVALSAAVMRDIRKGALLASAVLLAYVLYGRLGLPDPVPVGMLLLVLAGLAALGVAAWLLRDRAVPAVTAVTNVVACALVAVSLPSVVGALWQDHEPWDVPAQPAVAGGEANDAARDIFYIVPDRYPRQDTLEDVFDFDNSPFLSGLEDRGFDVADGALGNYPRTAHSLAAALNMRYLDDLESTVPPGRRDDWGPVYSLLGEHRVGELLTDAGYTYHHIGNWWSPTKRAASADVVHNYETGSEFGRVFEQTTMLPALRHLVVPEQELSPREELRNHTLFAFDQLDELARADADGPRFVFAHVLVPHDPYVFAADGSYVTKEEDSTRSRAQQFVPQVEYTNLRIEAVVDRLLDRPPDEQPIIVLQSDEGPHPVALEAQGPDYSWADAPRAELREKLRILTAVHLPDGPALPEDITPVNLFRLVLDSELDTNLGLLPDRAYRYPDVSRLYDFDEVTDQVR